MSRCFPFPPPGYEKKTRSDHADLLAEEKRKEKKHKKEKRNKEKREGKEKRDKDRSKDKHKEKKDRREKHKDKKKKEKDKDKSRIYDKADKQTESPHGDLLGECSQKNEEIKHSKFTVELERRIKNEEKVAANRKVENFSGSVQKSTDSLGAATAMVKGRVATDKIIPPSMGAPHGRIDGLERPADKFTVSTQRRNEVLVSANAVQKERSTGDKLVPKLANTGQRGNGGVPLRVENQVGSVQRRSEGPYAATATEVDNNKNNKVASASNSAVQRTINGMARPAQGFTTHKNVESIGLAIKMADRGEANKIVPNHNLMEQRRIGGIARTVEKDTNNRIEEGKAKNREREADGRKENRHKDQDHDQKKIKDKCKHKGKEKEKAKVKEKGEEKHKEPNEPRDSRKKDQLDSLNLMPLAPQTDKARNYQIDENIKKRKEIDTNGYLNENNMRPNKSPRTNSSSQLHEENGRTLESSHIGTAFPSVKPEGINNTLAGKPVDSKEHKINGIADAQPSAGLMHPVAGEAGATGKVYTKPHPDSMYLNQIYSIPKVDEWPEYDDQEWLFSSCHLLQKHKSKLEGDEVSHPQVWSEALRIDSEDVVALPYVVPF